MSVEAILRNVGPQEVVQPGLPVFPRAITSLGAVRLEGAFLIACCPLMNGIWPSWVVPA